MDKYMSDYRIYMVNTFDKSSSYVAIASGRSEQEAIETISNNATYYGTQLTTNFYQTRIGILFAKNIVTH